MAISKNCHNKISLQHFHWEQIILWEVAPYLHYILMITYSHTANSGCQGGQNETINFIQYIYIIYIFFFWEGYHCPVILLLLSHNLTWLFLYSNKLNSSSDNKMRYSGWTIWSLGTKLIFFFFLIKIGFTMFW